jgi:hypothetical protein
MINLVQLSVAPEKCWDLVFFLCATMVLSFYLSYREEKRLDVRRKVHEN